MQEPFWDRARQIVEFRIDAIIHERGRSAATAAQLQRLGRRLAPRRPTIRKSRDQIRVEMDQQAINESTARVTGRGF